jgi:hypothetical protein
MMKSPAIQRCLQGLRRSIDALEGVALARM